MGGGWDKKRGRGVGEGWDKKRGMGVGEGWDKRRGMGVGEGWDKKRGMEWGKRGGRIGDKKGESGIKRETVNIMGNCGIMIL